MWSVGAEKPLVAYLAHQGEALALAVDPRDGVIVTAGTDGAVRLWDPDVALFRGDHARRIDGLLHRPFRWQRRGRTVPYFYEKIGDSKRLRRWSTDAAVWSESPVPTGFPWSSSDVGPGDVWSE